ncbi:hypothetical protein [Phyllobacterium sp. YR531]|uniref:hypothetical protein n=1 Tax=Phyllobacterium sp. YR531 TaxID=1144343 RepID=UPI0012F6BE8F|nr:hypothetical protein [Phyllobacterium sp. YR531]
MGTDKNYPLRKPEICVRNQNFISLLIGFFPPRRCLDLTKTFAGRASALATIFDEVRVNRFAFFLTVAGASWKKCSDSKPFLGLTFCCSAESGDQKKIINIRLTVALAGESGALVQPVEPTFSNLLKINEKEWLSLSVLHWL